MNRQLTIRTITDHCDPALPAIHRIYQQVFPITERKPLEWFDQILQRRDYSVLAAENASQVKGFAIFFAPEDFGDAALLEYLAVDPAEQNKGCGSALLKAAISLTDRRPMLVEVESTPNPQALQRQNFYHRHGFRVVESLHYILPLPNAPPMLLMLLNSPAVLTKDHLTRWITTIYQSVYQCLADDPRLQKMFRGQERGSHESHE